MMGFLTAVQSLHRKNIKYNYLISKRLNNYTWRCFQNNEKAIT
jgi:hypothetical protein